MILKLKLKTMKPMKKKTIIKLLRKKNKKIIFKEKLSKAEMCSMEAELCSEQGNKDNGSKAIAIFQ